MSFKRARASLTFGQLGTVASFLPPAHLQQLVSQLPTCPPLLLLHLSCSYSVPLVPPVVTPYSRLSKVRLASSPSRAGKSSCCASKGTSYRAHRAPHNSPLTSPLPSEPTAPTVSTVYSIGRRAPDLPADTPGLNKLKHEAFDYDALLSNPAGSEANKLKSFDADAVVIALGTTRAQAGSAEAFVKIDREYVLAAAKAAKVEKAQKLVYCSVSLK